ncbi:MAG: hypothetical protein HQK51_00845 [Oligoflexia bacterium]|nr:hypothetical protein [Oligoflexia bacterium]
MKKRNIFLLAIFMFINCFCYFCLSTYAYSSIGGVSHKDLKHLKAEIDEKIVSMNEMMNSINDNYTDNDDRNIDNNKDLVMRGAICAKEKQDEMYYLNSIWLKFTAEVSIKVAIVSLKIAPSFGFIWGRSNPKDWKNY